MRCLARMRSKRVDEMGRRQSRQPGQPADCQWSCVVPIDVVADLDHILGVKESLARRILSDAPGPERVVIGSARKVGMTTDCSTGRAEAWTAVGERGDPEQCLGFAAFPQPARRGIRQKSGPNQM